VRLPRGKKKAETCAQLNINLRLVEQLEKHDHSSRFSFKIGGVGFEDFDLPKNVETTKQYFVPHFNVQLYHLHGKKRWGESSGSLHRGISVPVIFEANGAERLEGVRVVKIDADDDLRQIDFKKAADEIARIAAQGIESALACNLAAAKKNSLAAFAQNVLECF
jgi:hypothetical protein